MSTLTTLPLTDPFTGERCFDRPQPPKTLQNANKPQLRASTKYKAVTTSEQRDELLREAKRPTQLEPHETNEPFRPHHTRTPAELPTSLNSCFRHSGWWRERLSVFAALQRVGVSSNRIVRFAECGSRAWVEGRIDFGASFVDPAAISYDNVRVKSNVCKDRFCQACAASRAALVSRGLVALLGDEPARFLTLTLKHNADPLKQRIDDLMGSYKKLRRSFLWASHVKAAAATLEVKYNVASDTWHPHLHILTHGKYLPHAELKAEWLKATGDSYIVDIRYVRNHVHAARYLAKYVTKPMTHQYRTRPDRLDEAILALHGRRTLLLTGTWRGVKVDHETQPGTWEHLGSLQTIMSKAIDGDAVSRRILHVLNDRGPRRVRMRGRSP